jgi:hypothetical protein
MQIKIASWIAAFLCLLFSSCSKDSEKLRFYARYDWVETQIYLEEEDTVITIRPTSHFESYRIEYKRYSNYEYGYIYHGDTLKMEGAIVDFDPATGEETSCLYEEYCWKWEDNFQLCERFFRGDTVVIYQFPFLDGKFYDCHSSSLFRSKFYFY